MRAELLDDPRLTVVGLFMEAHEGLTTKFSTRFESHSLSETEFEVLLRLARTPNGRLRMTDLSAQTSLSTSGITRVVDRLERDGLVARDTCEEDRRGTWARITDFGIERISAVLPGHLDDVQEWFIGLLPPVQLTALADALRVVRDAVHPEAVAGG